MTSESESVPPIYIVWRRAAEIRQGWSEQTRWNRRRKAKILLRRIGLDESLLPPVAAHYESGDRRYCWAESIREEPQSEYDLPPANPGLVSSVTGVRPRAMKNPA